MTVISPASLAPATRSAARLNSAAAPVCTILMPSSVLARGAYVIAPLFPWLLSQLLELTTGLHVAPIPRMTSPHCRRAIDILEASGKRRKTVGPVRANPTRSLFRVIRVVQQG